MGNSYSTNAPSSATSAACPRLDTDAPSTSGRESSCPVPESYRNPAIYDVYSRRINDPSASSALDPKNNMPVLPNQQPCPGQRRPLPTERMQSTIPKGGTDATWVYPSPQMFFNGASLESPNQ